MLAKAPSGPCCGGDGRWAGRPPRPGGVAGGSRRGGAGGARLVAAAAAGERRAAPEAVAGRKQRVNGSAVAGMTSTVGKSTNILWHDCPIGQPERQKLLNQKGCVVWITGLSGSGKSTLACMLSHELYSRGHLTYVLDGDNLRHGLNRDLGFKAEDRAENIRRVGEVAKLFADAGVICIASLISPYRSDRNACRNLVHNSSFIEVFLNVPLEICEARDPKGLYKLARSGKIKGFTGIDDPYEPPFDCEIVIQCKVGDCATPKSMADQVVSYLEANGSYQHLRRPYQAPGGVRRIIVLPDLGYPDNDLNKGKAAKDLAFVLKSQGVVDKTLLFYIELLKIIPSRYI